MLPAHICPLSPVCGCKTYLNQEEEVRVLALGGGTLTVLDVLLGDINTLLVR